MSSSTGTLVHSKYTLWVADHDEAGIPINPIFVDAAYVLEPTLFRYRRAEIGCESLTATLVQSSVNAASRASRCEAVLNPIGYLLRTFTRKVDRHLSNASRELAVEEDFIEDIQSREDRNNHVARMLEDRILLQQVKDQMDDWTRQVFNMRAVGHSMEEIARDLGMSANAAYVRYFRGVSKAAERLLNPGFGRRQLKVDAE